MFSFPPPTSNGVPLPRRPRATQPPPKHRWQYGRHVVDANTKSEARSLLRRMGVVLPVGCGWRIERVGG